MWGQAGYVGVGGASIDYHHYLAQSVYMYIARQMVM